MSQIIKQVVAALPAVSVPVMLEKLSIDSAFAGDVTSTTAPEMVEFSAVVGQGTASLLT